MAMTNHISILAIDRTSSHFPAIKALWRAHAGTLGFFPEGAFSEYAAKQQILVATNSSQSLVGYLLFRVTPSRNDVSIVHLCVDSSTRNQGIARSLAKNLIDRTKAFCGIGLWCRRDFALNSFWPRLGFIPMADRDGKRVNGSTLTYWWYDHGHPNLFSAAQEKDLGQKLKVVIDANVFIDLKNGINEESQVLIADWLQNTVTLCITDELFNEIDRSKDQQLREECRHFASTFPTLRCDHEKSEVIFSSLQKHLPIAPRKQDNSDFSHLSKAIATGAHFFTTRDEALLERSDSIYTEFGISVLRPSDLITEIDSLCREQEYQPARLAGTLFKLNRVQSKQEDILAKTFQNKSNGEKQSKLKEILRELLSNPFQAECNVAWGHDNQAIALIAYKRGRDKELEIPLLRVIEHPLSSSLIRYLIGEAIRKASCESRTLIRITDGQLDSETRQALVKDKFYPSENGWIKLSLPISITKEGLCHHVKEIEINFPILKDYSQILCATLEQSDETSDITTLWQIELALWPAKITNLAIPCFIVPIKPAWAQHLFDEHMANQDLFGAKEHLAFNREAVYYRSKRNSFGLSAPGRILWYVSHDKHFHGSGQIRAHSRLDNVIVGQPKTLYRQFRRLGIYEWPDVFKVAKEDINNEIMALQFSETELLGKAISWDKLMGYLGKQGIKTTLNSPCPISEEIFFSLISSRLD